MSATLTSCVSDASRSSKPSEGSSWSSAYVRVDLIRVDAKDRATSKFDQFYSIRFKDSPSIYHVPSFLDRTEVAESFSKTSQSFGGSSIHFSPSGKTVVIDDDTPGAASGDGHKLIVGTVRDEPIVATLTGPERPGTVIEEWPRVTSVTDSEVTLQYDDDKRDFAISIDTLLQKSERVERAVAPNEL